MPGEERGRLLNAAIRKAADELKRGFEQATRIMNTTVPPLGKDEPATPTTAADLVRRCARFYYDRFELYDMTLFPMTYGADVGELAEVQVIRVSPEDAAGLICERDTDTDHPRIRKLAGTRVANFGAFLDGIWRRSDILWGRLDAAEILLEQLLPRINDQDEGTRQEKEAVRLGLIRRSQAAILNDELVPLGEQLGRRVLVEAFVHEPNEAKEKKDKAKPESLDPLLDQIEPHARKWPALRALLNRNMLKATYLYAFANERGLPPERVHRLVSRGVGIFGAVLQGIYGPQSKITKPLGRGLAYLGRAAWGIVECAAPESALRLFVRNWLHLLYVLELLLVLGGVFVPSFKAARELGQWLLLGTLGVHTLVVTLTLQYRGVKVAWRRTIVALAVIVAGLAAIGGYMLPAWWKGVIQWFASR
jgi:hypothetical protein